MSMNEIMGRTTSAGAMVTVEEGANIAEIQAKMILARNFPRDLERCMANILFECKNKKLAEKAMYEFPRGDSVVRGPSIRLVECVARHFGNILSGVKEISTSADGRKATVKSFCWDLESNFADEKIFEVEYTRTVKKGGIPTTYPITDPRDRYEMLANMGARRKRACVQAIIPTYIIDEAMEVCQETLENAIKKESGEKSIEEIRANMLEAFKGVAEWITEEIISEKIGKPFDSINEKDIVRLRSLYNAVHDKFITPEKAFDRENNRFVDDNDTKALEEVNAIIGKKTEEK